MHNEAKYVENNKKNQLLNRDCIKANILATI